MLRLTFNKNVKQIDFSLDDIDLHLLPFIFVGLFNFVLQDLFISAAFKTITKEHFEESSLFDSIIISKLIPGLFLCEFPWALKV